jgi:hypothetical protein
MGITGDVALSPYAGSYHVHSATKPLNISQKYSKLKNLLETNGARWSLRRLA